MNIRFEGTPQGLRTLIDALVAEGFSTSYEPPDEPSSLADTAVGIVVTIAVHDMVAGLAEEVPTEGRLARAERKLLERFPRSRVDIESQWVLDANPISPPRRSSSRPT